MMKTLHFVAAVIAATVASAMAQAQGPNFLFLIADDVGYNDLGCFGAPTISTPNIDRLAQEGLKFTQFYSAAPVCSPSRAAMLTGRLPVRVGSYTNTSYPLDMIYRVFLPSSVGCPLANETYISARLKDLGYSTYMIGKWHTGHNPAHNCTPTQRGFDYFYGLPYSHEEGFPGPLPESLVWAPVPLMENETVIEQPVDLTTLTPRYTAKTLELLDAAAAAQAKGQGSPFYMQVAYEEAHVPLFAAPEFQGVSRRGAYGDSMQQMDNSIGQIISKLVETGLAKNTYVVFTSDNGAWIDPSSGFWGAKGNPLNGGSNAPFQGGKGSTWEGGVREPAILWAPGRIAPGSLSMEIVNMMDFFPTFIELAGGKVPSSPVLDGASLVPLLNYFKPNGPYDTSRKLYRQPADPEPSIHNFVYYWREHTLYAIRGGPYKAHFFTRPGFAMAPPTPHDPPLLFNVEQDPGEQNPLNGTDYADILQALTIAANHHVADVWRAPSQYEAQDWTLVPCCDKPFNETEAYEFLEEGKPGLALWDECVCSNATDRPTARRVQSLEERTKHYELRLGHY